MVDYLPATRAWHAKKAGMYSTPNQVSYNTLRISSITPRLLASPHEEPNSDPRSDQISPLLRCLPTPIPILTTLTRHNRPMHQPRHSTSNHQNPTNKYKPKQSKLPTRNKRIRLLPRRTPSPGHPFSPPFILGFLGAEVASRVEVVQWVAMYEAHWVFCVGVFSGTTCSCSEGIP